ncbi:MAG: hypothetical protein IKS17_10235 [Firmicutes bacterium]|nr:hypothetical protein [Bacillota bacterium]
MANYTANYNLKKPLQNEYYNVDDFNGNADITDAGMKAALDRAKACTVLIAAQDSPQAYKNIADHVCEANDETVFQAAVTALAQSGGKIYIAPGSYTIRRFVMGGGNITFEGIGEAQIQNDLGIVSGGRALFKNLSFNKMLASGDVEELSFENCSFAASSCIQLSRGEDDTNIPVINARNCHFTYTGSTPGSISAMSVFIIYTQYATMSIKASVTGCTSSVKAYLPRKYADTSSIIKGAANINIDTLCHTGIAVIEAGNTSVVKDISKYGGDMTAIDFVYDTANFSYTADMYDIDYGTGGTYVPVTAAVSAADKKAAFMIGAAAAQDITITYRIVQNEL